MGSGALNAPFRKKTPMLKTYKQVELAQMEGISRQAVAGRIDQYVPIEFTT